MIRRELTLPLVVGLLLPTLCMLVIAMTAWGLYLRSEWKAAVQQAYSRSDTTARSIATDLEGVFRDYRAVIAELAERPAIRMMSDKDCDPVVPQYFELHKELVSVTVRDASGRLVCSSLQSPLLYLPDRLVPLYKKALEAGSFFVTAPILGEPNPIWIATMTYPVRDKDGAISGVVLASIDLSYFSRRLFTDDIGDMVITVVSPDFKVVLRSKDAELWLGKSLPDALSGIFRKGASGNFMTNDLQGISRVGSFVTVPSVKWKVALGYPTSEVLEPYQKAIAYAAVIGSLGIVGAVLLAVLLARWTTRPISELARVAENVSAGNAQFRATPGGPREIVNVAMQFNNMLNSLQQLQTQEEAATAALGLSEERFRLLAKATSDVIWDWDIDNNIVWWSESLSTQFGHVPSKPRMSIDDSYDMIAEQDQQRVRNSVTRLLSGTDAVWRLAYGFKRADGSVADVIGSGLVIRDDHGHATRMVGSIVDNTERISLESRLQQAQKLEAVGQLTGGIAHDFNNLLTVILGNAEVLTFVLPAGTEESRSATRILNAAERGAELIDRLLAFARRQPLKPMLVRPQTILNGLNDMLERSLGEHIELVTTLRDTWTTFADAGQLEAATLNLVLNARDAMPNGGRITIEASDQVLVDGAALGIPSGDYIVISVSDTGFGMSPDTMAKAFEPFFTTKGIGQGSGLGLSMVHGFLKQSGGTAKMSSELNKGTTVQMYFPRVNGEAVATRQHSFEVNLGKGERILVVEDDKSVAEFVVNQLVRSGYNVRVAHSGKDAIAQLKSNADIDLLLTDVVMPGGMDGLQLAEESVGMTVNLRVLFMSGYEDNVLMENGRLKPNVDLLRKPFNRAALLRAVRNALEQAQERKFAPNVV